MTTQVLGIARCHDTKRVQGWAAVKAVALDGERERRERKPAERFFASWRLKPLYREKPLPEEKATKKAEQDTRKNRPPLRLRMTRGFKTLRWFVSGAMGWAKKPQTLGMTTLRGVVGRQAYVSV